MKRFFGMMPSKEVKRQEIYKSCCGQIIVQAGEKGWTVIYADGSSRYEDTVDTTNSNFDKAINLITKKFGKLEKI